MREGGVLFWTATAATASTASTARSGWIVLLGRKGFFGGFPFLFCSFLGSGENELGCLNVWLVRWEAKVGTCLGVWDIEPFVVLLSRSLRFKARP